MLQFQNAAVKNFNRKIYAGSIKYEVKNCLCDFRSFSRIFSYDRYGLWHPTVICKRCGLIQSNPRLLNVEYDKFYSSDEYRYLYEGENFLDLCKLRYGSSNHIFKQLFSIISDLGLHSILEFGCGGGWNLLPFYEAGYKVKGYDYSFSLAFLGKSYGLDIINGSYDELQQNDDKFDVIILNHVIEHFTDLFYSLNFIIRYLNNNGIVYIAVPNIDNFAKSQFQNAHVYYFSPRTFKYYLSVCNLELMQFGSVETIHMSAVPANFLMP